MSRNNGNYHHYLWMRNSEIMEENLLGRYEEGSTTNIYIDNIGIKRGDILKNCTLNFDYEVLRIIPNCPDTVICVCKKKETKIVNYHVGDILGNSGNIAIGENIEQSIIINNSFDCEKFINSLNAYLVGQGVDLSKVCEIKEEVNELSNEIDKKNESNIHSVLKKIKEKVDDVTWDMVKDGIKDTIKEQMKNPLLWETVLHCCSGL